MAVIDTIANKDRADLRHRESIRTVASTKYP